MPRVDLKIADSNAAIRYLGEVHSRPLDPIHEVIQNLIDEGATRLDIDLDRHEKQLRISGNARPIRDTDEARRILQSVCRSEKIGKLGEKGIGMLSFINAGDWMLTESWRRGKRVWFRLRRESLEKGEVGADGVRPLKLRYIGTQTTIGGVASHYFKTRFTHERVAREVLIRWAQIIRGGVRISVNRKTLRLDDDALDGIPFRKTIQMSRNNRSGRKGKVRVDLVILEEPSDLASVAITHKGQANFDVSKIPLFEHTVFTSGSVHGTISGDAAPINANRTGFVESKEFQSWQRAILKVRDRLEKIVAEKSQAAAQERDQGMIDKFMEQLKEIFTEEVPDDAPGKGLSGGVRAGSVRAGSSRSAARSSRRARSSQRLHKAGPGRLPTVPSGTFGEFAPSIRVWRSRKEFKINVKHPDYIEACKTFHKRRNYIREVCIQEAFLFSLDKPRRKQMEDLSDEFMTYWTKAFVTS